MKNIKIELIELLTKEIEDIFSKKTERQLKSDLKDDDSIVTEIDYLVSNFLKEALRKHPVYQRYNFFSEEDFKSLNFPAAIVDPIDGTRELARGRAECAVSLAMMHSNDLNDPLKKL
jgi:fructose-1,6-bisphosphatase/inositol monophosphatase family enzyme